MGVPCSKDLNGQMALELMICEWNLQRKVTEICNLKFKILGSVEKFIRMTMNLIYHSK
jgi:hypothetical protein